MAIPASKRTDFYRNYIDDASEGKQMSIYEKLSDNYKMFVDIQIPIECDLKTISNVIVNTFKLFVPDNFKHVLDACFVCKSDVHNSKVCCRFVWPNFVVDSERALTMRERLVFELSDIDTEANAVNSAYGSDNISYSGYSDEGAIMIGSQQHIEVCKDCKGKKKERVRKCMSPEAS